MRRPWVLCIIVLLALPWASLGCNDDEDQQRRQQDRERRQFADQARRAQEQAEQAQKHAVDVERRRDQDRRVHQAREEETRSDTSAAMALWIASSAALAIVILALVREKRIRHVLQGLVRRMLRQREAPP